MDTDSRYKQSQIEKLEGQARSMQNQISSLQNQLRHRPPEGQQQYQQQTPEPQTPGQVARSRLQQPDGNTPEGGYVQKRDQNYGQSQTVRREAAFNRQAGVDDIRITDEQKETLFHNLQEMVKRGERLTAKQSRLYQLLLELREAENAEAGRNQAFEHHDPQGQVPPDTDGRTPQPLTVEPSLVYAGNKLPQQQPEAGNGVGQQPGGFGMGQQLAGNGAGQQPAGNVVGQQPGGFGMGQQPGGNGAGQQPAGNVVGQQPGGFGMGQQLAGNGVGQQPAGNVVGQEQGGFGMGQEPSRMVPSPAHDQQQQQHPRDEQEEVQDIADPGKEGGPQLQFENLGEDKQQKLKKEENEEEMEAFDPAEIAKQARKHTSDVQESENGQPLPQPVHKNQNPDKEFDDYHKEDDGDEDGQYGREYEDEDRYGDHQLRKDKEEEEQRILRRRNVEQQLQQPALSEQDGHRKPDEQKQRLCVCVCVLHKCMCNCLSYCSLVPRPHPLTRRNGLVNQVEFLGLTYAFATM